MQKEISNFLKECRIASIACIDADNKPYSFHCFYAFDESNNLLFFKSSANTYHSKFMGDEIPVSGSILPDKIDIIALKGIQFTGIIKTKDFPVGLNPDLYYHKKLPLALAKQGQVWCIQLQMIKMTDNTNLFGKKLKWEKPNNSEQVHSPV